MPRSKSKGTELSIISKLHNVTENVNNVIYVINGYFILDHKVFLLAILFLKMFLFILSG